MELAECEQSRCGRGGSRCVEREKADDVVGEVYADSEFSGSVNQRDHGPQQTRNEEVVREDREPAACAHLRVEEVRHGKYHGCHERQKNAVGRDQARALHDVPAKEKLLGGRLDRGEDQRDRHEERERLEVGVEGEAIGVEEVLSQHTYQTQRNGPRHKPLSNAPPAYLLPRRDERQGMTTVDEGDGEECPAEKTRETRHDHQEVAKGTERS